MSLEDIARIIEAEAGVLDFQGKLAVAQCICDNRFDANAFTHPADHYSPDSMAAAEMAVLNGVRRLPHAHLLQFRSFKNYGINGGSEPDFGKIYGSGMMPDDCLYLGKDASGQWGHF